MNLQHQVQVSTLSEHFVFCVIIFFIIVEDTMWQIWVSDNKP